MIALNATSVAYIYPLVVSNISDFDPLNKGMRNDQVAADAICATGRSTRPYLRNTFPEQYIIYVYVST